MGQYRKLIVAALTAALTTAAQVVPMTDTWRGWVTVMLAVLGAVTVWAVPNDITDAQYQELRETRHRAL